MVEMRAAILGCVRMILRIKNITNNCDRNQAIYKKVVREVMEEKLPSSIEVKEEIRVKMLLQPGRRAITKSDK